MKLTPGMQQYMEIKNANPDCIILFRMGDFYETFFEDAKIIARELEITLTSRGKGESQAPLAGIPYHSIGPYIAKLVKKGYKVGVVEQTEDPKKAKGLVKRDLVRIITPGTVFESLILNERENNYIVAFSKSNNYALSVCDVSTGEFKVVELNEKQFLNELKRLQPAEIIAPMSLETSDIHAALKELYVVHSFDDRHFFQAEETLMKHFDIINVRGFDLTPQMKKSCGGLLAYLKETQMNALSHINSIKKYSLDNFMHLDASTIRNLELKRNIMSNNEDGTLISVLDKTVTPMGKRLLRKWITEPLKDQKEIMKRLDAVESLKSNLMKRFELKKHLENMYDMERLIGRVSFGTANPKDLISLKISLKEQPKVKKELFDESALLLKDIATLPDLSTPEEIIEKAIKDEPNTTIREGNIIKEGYHEELDELRKIRSSGKEFLADLEEKEKEKTGIKSLKIKYNKVFGYFIEVTKSNLHMVPANYVRKQTQVNAERFITEELKEMETKILGAEERMFELEYELFQEVLLKLVDFITPIQESAVKLAALDCLIAFADIAEKHNYCKPSLNGIGELNIVEGRHPVVEAGIDFVSNNCSLTGSEMMIITGPNMAGKSTYMRQVALIALMAQIGSFVPAKNASLPVFDRIFTRIGAYDDLVSGQSTFMVEMNETANILHNATPESLVILDEIGRGTSTYDGLSLAWSIAEDIHTRIKAKTLFATHYHYLNELSREHKGIRNFNIAVDEKEDEIIFLRKIIEGGTNRSYGIQVAKLAGVPDSVVLRAKEVMKKYDKKDLRDYF